MGFVGEKVNPEHKKKQVPLATWTYSISSKDRN